MDVCDHECTCKFKPKENKNLQRTTKCLGPKHPTPAPPLRFSTAHTSTQHTSWGSCLSQSRGYCCGRN